MKITVTTSSQTLSEILSEAQISNYRKSRFTAATSMQIQNLGGQDIYVEVGADATVANGYKIVASTGVATLSMHDLTQINLIANSSNNTDVRLLFGIAS